MSRIKKGDIVGRKSYGKDIIFVVKNIIETPKKQIAILTGIIERIEADCDLEDLELINRKEVKERTKKVEDKVEKRIAETKEQLESRNYKSSGILNKRTRPRVTTGKILHLDRR